MFENITSIFAIGRHWCCGHSAKTGDWDLTDLQIAALVWRHQMELFTQLVASAWRNDNVRSLYFRPLLEDPKARVLRAANDAPTI